MIIATNDTSIVDEYPEWGEMMSGSLDDFLFFKSEGHVCASRIDSDGSFEWHGYIVPESRKMAVQACKSFFEYLASAGITDVVTYVEDDYIATRNFIKKRLGFQHVNGNKFHLSLNK